MKFSRETTVDEKRNGCSWHLFDGVNRKGESVLVEVSRCESDLKNKHDLMKAWVKHGFLKKPIKEWWYIDVYVTDEERNCWGLYNPQIKRAPEGSRSVIDFDWILEATEENLEKLLDEVYRRATEEERP